MSLGCWGPMWVPIWHIMAYHPYLRSWMPLDPNFTLSTSSKCCLFWSTHLCCPMLYVLPNAHLIIYFIPSPNILNIMILSTFLNVMCLCLKVNSQFVCGYWMLCIFIPLFVVLILLCVLCLKILKIPCFIFQFFFTICVESVVQVAIVCHCCCCCCSCHYHCHHFFCCHCCCWCHVVAPAVAIVVATAAAHSHGCLAGPLVCVCLPLSCLWYLTVKT